MRAARYRRRIRTTDVSFPERALAVRPQKAAHLNRGVHGGVSRGVNRGVNMGVNSGCIAEWIEVRAAEVDSCYEVEGGAPGRVCE